MSWYSGLISAFREPLNEGGFGRALRPRAQFRRRALSHLPYGRHLRSNRNAREASRNRRHRGGLRDATAFCLARRHRQWADSTDTVGSP